MKRIDFRQIRRSIAIALIWVAMQVDHDFVKRLYLYKKESSAPETVSP